MANLAFSIATEDENNPNPFKNYKYIYRAYQKVTKENVQTFMEKEEWRKRSEKRRNRHE